MLVLGASSTPICGVRAHATRLNQAFDALPGVSADLVWWERPHAGSPAQAIAGLRSFLGDVRRTAGTQRPDRIVVHYSVLSWASAGQPWAVPFLARELRALGLPVTAFLHEYAVPVRRDSLRSAAFGAGHLPALAMLLSLCDSAVVTTEQRLRALRVSRWSRRLPLAFVPVFSTVEPWGERASAAAPALVLGIFGFGTPSYPAATVLHSVSRLRSMGFRVRLRLIGAPGDAGSAGQTWRQAAEAAGCSDLLEFTGVLAEAGVSAELAAVDLLIFPDPGGPAARKTTLAAALAHGLAVVAFDGSQRWDRLCASGAIVLASPHVDGLTATLALLLGDEDRRRAVGDRARRFYGDEMAPEVAARHIVDFLGAGTGGRTARTGPR